MGFLGEVTLTLVSGNDNDSNFRCEWGNLLDVPCVSAQDKLSPCLNRRFNLGYIKRINTDGHVDNLFNPFNDAFRLFRLRFTSNHTHIDNVSSCRSEAFGSLLNSFLIHQSSIDDFREDTHRKIFAHRQATDEHAAGFLEQFRTVFLSLLYFLQGLLLEFFAQQIISRNGG